MREAAVQQRVQLRLAQSGALVYRNNTGACVDQTGRVIRYGLANESKQQNDQIKSSDLIGVVPVRIEPHHVGRTMGIFAAIECKHPDWHITPGDARAAAQLRFINLVRSVGGIGSFVTDAAAVGHILDTWRLTGAHVTP